MRLCIRALSYFREEKIAIFALLVCIAASTGLGLLAAWPMAILVDSVFGSVGRSDLPHRVFLSILPSTRIGQIVGLAVIGLVMKLAGDLLGVVQTILNNHINWRGLRRIRSELYRKLQALSLDYHRSQPQGDAIYRLTYDTLGFGQILSVVISGLVACVTLVCMMVTLMSRHVGLTLLAMSITPVLAAANIIWGRRLTARTIDCKEAETRLTTHVQRSLASIGLVQAFGREKHELSLFQQTIDGTIRSWWRHNRQQMLYNVIVGATFGVGGAIVFGYGGYLVSKPASGLTIGDLMIFTSYLGMLWGPLCTLTGFSMSLSGGVAGARRVFEILDREAKIQDRPNARPLPVKPRRIALNDVELAYSPGHKVLRGVSAEIEPGEFVAFVGPSGVGKSTLLNLLMRFQDPSSGEMTFDGIDARDIRLNDLRKHVALVLQEPVMLAATIAENIAYGRPTATPTEIREAARLAGAADFIEALPQGYDTQINENGSNLSGGQRQRISIARALLTRAPVLVLDEPTSALDNEHERQILQTLQSIKGKRTIVLVTHRLEALSPCDQIFVMHAGKVAESGTHEELLLRRGLYASWLNHEEPSRTVHAAA